MLRKILIGIILVLAVSVSGLLLVPGDLVKAHTLVVTANYTKDPPGGLDDSVWRKAQAVQFLIEGREKSIGSNGTVTTRALYTDDSLFFLFKWKDPTRSIIKQSVDTQMAHGWSCSTVSWIAVMKTTLSFIQTC